MLNISLIAASLIIGYFLGSTSTLFLLFILKKIPIIKKLIAHQDIDTPNEDSVIYMDAQHEANIEREINEQNQ